jgi:hypothetical protein
MNTEWPNLHFTKPLAASWMRSRQIKFHRCAEESIWHWVLLLDYSPHLPLRHGASRSKLSCSQVVPTAQPSNMVTNIPCGGKNTCNWYHRMEIMSLFALRHIQLSHRGISTVKLKIYRINGSKNYSKNMCNTILTTPRMHQCPSSSANRPSDVAVTVNINAEFHVMAVSPIIECFSKNLVHKYSHSMKFHAT